jgi:hypothetical protein
VIDAFARYRITDMLRFYQTVTNIVLPNPEPTRGVTADTSNLMTCKSRFELPPRRVPVACQSAGKAALSWTSELKVTLPAHCCHPFCYYGRQAEQLARVLAGQLHAIGLAELGARKLTGLLNY